MYERIQVVRALPELSGSERTDGDGAAGSRLFKSRFFRPRCHSQAPADIPIDVQQAHLRENRPCSPWQSGRYRTRLVSRRLVVFFFFSFSFCSSTCPSSRGTSHSTYFELYIRIQRGVRGRVSNVSSFFFLSARRITGLRSRQGRNKPPTYLYYERGRNTEEKSDRLRERLSHFA